MSALPLHHPRFLESGGLQRPSRRIGTGRGRTNRAASPLEFADTRQRLAPALESTFTNSLNLKSPRIRASWPSGSTEVLWRSASAVTRLECTDTKNAPASPLECTDTNSLDLKFPGITLFQKKVGVGGLPRQNVQTLRRTCPGARVAALTFPEPRGSSRMENTPAVDFFALVASNVWHPIGEEGGTPCAKR